MTDQVRFAATAERHHPGLPLYCIVPGDAVRIFGAKSTFVVGVTLNDSIDIGRRTVKAWGDGRWFTELTKEHCRKAGIAEGDRVMVTLRTVPSVSPELMKALQSAGLVRRWERLTEAQKRALAEDVLRARTEATRTRRIRHLVERLSCAQASG